MRSKLIYLLLFVTVFWAMYRFGATETPRMYRFFIYLAATSMLAAWLLPVSALLKRRFIPFWLVGAVILGGILLNGSLEGWGYVHLGIGWLTGLIALILIDDRSGGRRVTESPGHRVTASLSSDDRDATYELRTAHGTRGSSPATDALNAVTRSRGHAVTGTGSRAHAVTARAQRPIFLFLIILGAFEALFGLMQSIGGVDYIGEYYRGAESLATGTLINRNTFAGLLNMTIPLAVGGIFASFAGRIRRERRESEAYAWAWIILLSCAIMALAIFLSLSRGGVVSFLASMIFAAILLGWGKRVSSRSSRSRNLAAGLATLLLVTTLGLAVWVGIDALLARFLTIETDRPNDRTIVYSNTVDLIQDHPLAGVGPGMYQWAFRPYQQVSPQALYEYGHNDYLEFTAEWGIPIAAAFWLFVLWCLYRSTQTFLYGKNSWQQGIALGCATAIFSLLLHSLVDGNLQIPANLAVFALILAISWSNGQEKHPQNSSGNEEADSLLT